MGVDVAADERPLVPGRGAGSPGATVWRQVFAQRGPRALQSALDRRDAGVEQRRGVGCGPAEHVAGDEHGALGRRQPLHRDKECELDRLPGDGGLGRRVGRGGGGEQSVGHGLQPRHVRGRTGVLSGQRRGPVGLRDAPPLGDEVEARVGGDLVEPRAERRPPLVGRSAPPRAQQCLLHDVVGVVAGAEHAVAVDAKLVPVAVGEFTERGLVAVAHGGEYQGLHVVTHGRSPLVLGGFRPCDRRGARGGSVVCRAPQQRRSCPSYPLGTSPALCRRLCRVRPDHQLSTYGRLRASGIPTSRNQTTSRARFNCDRVVEVVSGERVHPAGDSSPRSSYDPSALGRVRRRRTRRCSVHHELLLVPGECLGVRSMRLTPGQGQTPLFRPHPSTVVMRTVCRWADGRRERAAAGAPVPPQQHPTGR